MVKIILIIFMLFFISATLANDPTRPPIKNQKTAVKKSVSAKTKQPLTAIFIRNNRRVAMLDGKLYRPGEYYRGSRIINIDHDKVLLRSNEGNFQLTLIPKIKK